MGCFNTTGFISQLPILDNDKVICFIATVKTDSPNGLYYPASLIAPYFLPIHGNYNSYGYLENIQETPITKIICKYAETDNLEELLSSITRENKECRAKIKLPNTYTILGDTYSVGEFTLLFEHEDLYNEITDKDNYLINSFNNVYTILGWYVNFLDKIKKYTSRIPKLPFSVTNGYVNNYYNDELPEELQEEYDKYCTVCIEEKVAGFFRDDNTLFLFDRLTTEDTITSLLKGKEDLRRFLNLYALYQSIPSYFKLSKTAGEQNYDLKSFKLIHNAVGDKLKRIVKEEKEREEQIY